MLVQNRSEIDTGRQAEGCVSCLCDRPLIHYSNVKRLLHPGAETKDLITQYISTIRCLRILDPQGVLLHKIADPIRKHLRDRSDTIKCLVATLVEGEDLGDENEPTHGSVTGGIGVDGGHSEVVEDFSDPKWEPEPVDAAPGKSHAQCGGIS